MSGAATKKWLPGERAARKQEQKDTTHAYSVGDAKKSAPNQEPQGSLSLEAFKLTSPDSQLPKEVCKYSNICSNV